MRLVVIVPSPIRRRWLTVLGALAVAVAAWTAPALPAAALPRVTGYQFESGTLTGDAVAREPVYLSARPSAWDYETVTGSYVTGTGAEGSAVTVRVDAPYDGYFPFTVRYANVGSETSSLTLSISRTSGGSRTSTQQLRFPVTPSVWGGYLSTVKVNKLAGLDGLSYLTEGRNYLTFRHSAEDSGETKLDELLFSSPDPLRRGNRLENAGFETGDLAGWREWHPDGQAAAYGVDEADPHSGDQKLWFFADRPFRQSVHQVTTPASDAASQRVEAWVRLRAYGGAAPATARMEVGVPGQDEQHLDISPADGWQKVTALVAPGASSIDVGFYLDARAGTSLEVDDVSVRPLVRNGGFEDGLDGWQQWHSDQVVSGVRATTDDKTAGSASALFYAAPRGIPDRQVDQSLHQVLTGLPDGRYVYSADIKLAYAADQVPQAARLEVSDHGADPVHLDLRPMVGQGWTRVSTTVEVTSGRIDLGLYLSSTNLRDSSPTLLVDEVSLTRE